MLRYTDSSSGGKSQRLSIARALLKNAPVVALDAATAWLDVDESFTQAALEQLVKNKTVLGIAHRMRTIAEADDIVVLEPKGRLYITCGRCKHRQVNRRYIATFN